MNFTNTPTSSGTTNSDAWNASNANATADTGMPSFPSSSFPSFQNFGASIFAPFASQFDFDLTSSFPQDQGQPFNQFNAGVLPGAGATLDNSNLFNLSNGYDISLPDIYPTPYPTNDLPIPSQSASFELHGALYPSQHSQQQMQMQMPRHTPLPLPSSNWPQTYMPIPMEMQPQIYPTPPPSRSPTMGPFPPPVQGPRPELYFTTAPVLQPPPSDSVQLEVTASTPRATAAPIVRTQAEAGPGPRTAATRALLTDGGAVCDVCFIRIAHAKDMARHKKTHLQGAAKDKELRRCLLCDHSTMQKTNMERHFKSVHLKERGYVCTYPNCEFNCGDPSGLNKHQKRAHGVGPKRRRVAPPNNAKKINVEIEKGKIAGKEKMERRDRREEKAKVRGVRKEMRPPMSMPAPMAPMPSFALGSMAAPTSESAPSFETASTPASTLSFPFPYFPAPAYELASVIARPSAPVTTHQSNPTSGSISGPFAVPTPAPTPQPPSTITNTTSSSSSTTLPAPHAPSSAPRRASLAQVAPSIGPIRRRRETREERHVRQLEEQVGIRRSGADAGFLRGRPLHPIERAKLGQENPVASASDAKLNTDRVGGAQGDATMAQSTTGNTNAPPRRPSFGDVTNATNAQTRDHYPNAHYSLGPFAASSDESSLASSLAQLQLHLPDHPNGSSSSYPQLQLPNTAIGPHLFPFPFPQAYGYAHPHPALANMSNGGEDAEMGSTPAQRVEAARKGGRYGGAFPLGDIVESMDGGH